MNPLEIAKEAISIASNAGLKKDVIDLLDKKVGLLADENVALKSEVASLNRKVADLEQELERLRPGAERLLAVQEEFLKVLYQSGVPLALDSMSSILRLEYEIVEHHADVLKDVGMIRWTGRGAGDWGKGLHTYELSEKGKAYIRRHKLV
jgi:hypothetical protein